MKQTHSRFAIVLVLSVAAGICLMWLATRNDRSAPSIREVPDTSAGLPSSPPSPAPPAVAGHSASTETQSPAVVTRESLDTHFAALSAAKASDEARAALEALRAYLKTLDPEVAAGLVRDFLASGRDADLPLDFRIGTGGFLDTPPTFRMALLDMLGWLNPRAAAELGREVLAAPTTADEWAVSLRNVARIETSREGRDYLRRKTEELIANPDWQTDPSIGYLNAFDVLVHVEAVESAPLLSGIVQRKDRPDLSHAGFLTLDRLTRRAPEGMLAALASDRALHQSRPEMVGQQFARADLRDSAQRQIVKGWLLAPERSPLELRAFGAIFPNHNQMLSTNLLTTEAYLNGADLRAHDTAALAQIETWLANPAFEEVRPHLAATLDRLKRLAGPAR